MSHSSHSQNFRTSIRGMGLCTQLLTLNTPRWMVLLNEPCRLLSAALSSLIHTLCWCATEWPLVQQQGWAHLYSWLEDTFKLHFWCWKTNYKLLLWTDIKSSKTTQLTSFSRTTITLCKGFLNYTVGRTSDWNWVGKKRWKTSAKIIGRCREPRSCLVKMDNCALTQCNKRHLQAFPESADPTDQQQLQSERPPVQMSSSPIPEVIPSHSDKTLDQAKIHLQGMPHSRPVQVTSRSHEVRIPLRYTTSRCMVLLNFTLLSSLFHKVACVRDKDEAFDI